MRTTTVKLYSLEYNQLRTYWAVTLFVAGNMILPQLCHLVPQGGIRWLPIYFFTLVGAYKYGWRVGLLTAVLSPCVNSVGKFGSFRDARGGRVTCRVAEIGVIGRGCRVCGNPFSEGLFGITRGSGTFLPDRGNVRRVDAGR